MNVTLLLLSDHTLAESNRAKVLKNPGQLKTTICIEVIVDQTANGFQHDI